MLAGSAYWQVDRAKRKEFDGLMDEKKAREKQAAWIKELEARDVEEKEMRDALRRRRERKDAAEKAWKGDDKVEGMAPGAPEEGKGKGILESVQDLIWKKK